jgi:universal stress protein A
MDTWRHILVAVDLSDDSERVVQRALDVAQRYAGSVRLLHVVEYVPVEPMGEALLPSMQIEEELLRGARARLDRLAEQFGIAPDDRILRSGSTKVEILRAAREAGVDLIVLGSRERHGLAIILNLTEDTVLHAAPCDVLAVRLPGSP